MTVRRPWTLVVAVLIAGIVLRPVNAEAACVGPAITSDRSELALRDTFEVRGTGFGTTCNDTPGAGRPLGDPEPLIELAVLQDGRAAPLATLGANCDYAFAVRLKLPTGLLSGPAQIIVARPAEHVEPIEIDVVASDVGSGGVGPTILAGRHASSTQSDCERGRVPWLRWGGAVAAAATAIVLVRRWRIRGSAGA